jgi:hypothetical protein
MHALLTEDGQIDNERIKALRDELHTVASILIES